MNEDRKSYLIDRIEECLQGLCRWDDAAWSFIVNITDSGDSTLFSLAPNEIRQEIFEVIRLLHEQGNYAVALAGVGEIDATERIRRLEELLRAGGFVGGIMDEY